jgi:dipeptide/tripeptide permease
MPLQLEVNISKRRKKLYYFLFTFFFAIVSGTPLNSPSRSPSRLNSDGDIKPTTSLKLPIASYYIVVVEGCERFCFYGLKAILLLYFMNFLGLNKDSATAGYHLFSFACYFTPTIGAVISDGFIGRYGTIISCSIVYLIGTIVLAITAIPKIGHMNLYI